MKRILLLLGLLAIAAFILSAGGGYSNDDNKQCSTKPSSWTGNRGTSKVRISQSGVNLSPKTDNFSNDDNDDNTPKCGKTTDGKTQLVLGTVGTALACKCVCPGPPQALPTVTTTKVKVLFWYIDVTTTSCPPAGCGIAYTSSTVNFVQTWSPVQLTGSVPNCVCPAGTGNAGNPPQNVPGTGATTGVIPPNNLSCNKIGG